MYAVFDIGGTKTRLALTDGNEIVGDALIYETPQAFDLGIDKLVSNCNKLSPDGIEGISGGIAGLLDPTKSILLNAPNLPEWSEKPFKSELEAKLKTNVKIENDAALAALGESVYGAGKDFKTVVFLAFGTGVGGARIIEKKLETNIFGFEPGHHIINSVEVLAGRSGELELYASGSGIQKRLNQKPQDINDPKIWEEVMSYISIGIVNTLYYWPCDVLVLGGGLIRHPLTDLHFIKRKTAELLSVFPESPPIVKSSLGELGCLHGAIAIC